MESNHVDAESDQYYPLTPIFCAAKDSAEELEWKKRFRQSFKVNPSQFKNNETKLEERCNTYSVDYISSTITDSVEATKDRKALLAKRCKAAAERIKWVNLSATEHKIAKARMITNRNKKHSTNRQQCLAIEAKAKRGRREILLKEQCGAQDVKYIPPKTKNESTNEKRVRRKAIRKELKHIEPGKKHSQKRRKRAEAIDRLYNHSICQYCNHMLDGSWARGHWKCTCTRPPPKEQFIVTGPGGAPIYSSSRVVNVYSWDLVPNCTTYTSDTKKYSENQASAPDFLHPVLYKDRDPLGDNVHVHAFEIDVSVQYRHIRTKEGIYKTIPVDVSKQCKNANGWGIKQQCKISDILTAEIHMNNTLFMKVGECRGVWWNLGSDFNNGISVRHLFYPLHGTTPWGWEECITLDVDIPMSDDIFEEATDLLNKYDDDKRGWNGSELYELLNARGIQHATFTTIGFEEYSIRRKDPTHDVIIRQIRENNHAAKYGPKWREILTQQKKEKEKREKENKIRELEERGEKEKEKVLALSQWI